MFEYDPNKSLSNKLKHGLDFDEAQALWEDANTVEVKLESTVELRFMVIGKIRKKHWSAIITYRNTNVRIISVRRARNHAVELYES